MPEEKCPEFIRMENYPDEVTLNRVYDVVADADSRMERIFLLCTIMEEYLTEVPPAIDKLEGIKNIIRDRAIFLRTVANVEQDPTNQCSSNRKGY